MKAERKQTEGEGEADGADGSSVNGLMKTISHPPFQVHKQLPIINKCCDSLRAAVGSSSQPSLLCMISAEMSCVVCVA